MRFVHKLRSSTCSRGGLFTSEVSIVGPRPSVYNSVRDRFNVSRRSIADSRLAYVVPGRGGDGAVSFDRFSRTPDGGSGGTGGAVWVVASEDVKDLSGIARRVVAKDGEHGRGKNQDGAKGEDAILRVPVGTRIKEVGLSPGEQLAAEREEFDRLDKATGTEEERVVRKWFRTYPGDDLSENYLLALTRHIEEAGWERGMTNGDSNGRMAGRKKTAGARWRLRVSPFSDEEHHISRASTNAAKQEFDLVTPDTTFLLAPGGTPGMGNVRLPAIAFPDTHSGAGSRRTTTYLPPRFATRAPRPTPRRFHFELLTISHIALAGAPNAGKSTLLRALSAATPKVGAYPFTTLHPNVGTLEYPDGHTLLVADIPGILEGANMGRGSGKGFLRHVERCSAVAYVVDLSAPAPWDDFAIIRRELELRDPSLLRRPAIVVGTKADISGVAKEAFAKLEAYCRDVVDVQKVVPVSGKYKKNIEKLKMEFRKVVEDSRTPGAESVGDHKEL